MAHKKIYADIKRICNSLEVFETWGSFVFLIHGNKTAGDIYFLR